MQVHFPFASSRERTPEPRRQGPSLKPVLCGLPIVAFFRDIAMEPEAALLTGSPTHYWRGRSARYVAL